MHQSSRERIHILGEVDDPSRAPRHVLDYTENGDLAALEPSSRGRSTGRCPNEIAEQVNPSAALRVGHSGAS